MLSPTLDSVRIFLHVLAAAVWVGGQITMAGIVPAVRRAAPAATRPSAQAFGRVAWPAYAVLIATGFWNLAVIDVANTSTAYQVTVLIKITLAILSGAAAAIHSFGRSTIVLAVGGAVGLLGGAGAMFLGVVLRTGT